jgi:hypothetical protein
MRFKSIKQRRTRNTQSRKIIHPQLLWKESEIIFRSTWEKQNAYTQQTERLFTHGRQLLEWDQAAKQSTSCDVVVEEGDRMIVIVFKNKSIAWLSWRSLNLKLVTRGSQRWIYSQKKTKWSKDVYFGQLNKRTFSHNIAFQEQVLEDQTVLCR